MAHKSLENVRKLAQGVLTLTNAFDSHQKVVSLEHIEEFLGSLVTNRKPMKAGFELSSPGSIILYNLLLVTKVGKLNLEIHIKWVHGKSFSGRTKIFGNGLIRSLAIRGQLPPINAKKPCSIADSIIPPLDPPKRDWGLG